jgi:hypothetical protein
MSESFDESIPVLTEVVAETAPVPAPLQAAAYEQEPAADLPTPPPTDTPIELDMSEALPHGTQQTVQPGAPASANAADVLDDDAWQALEERLVARVLDRLQDRVELTLEDQVRTSLAPVLDHVVARLAAELRAGLRQTVEQVVSRAVAQELAHLKARDS